MKKLIGIGIAAMMVMGLATVANAALTADANWAVNLKASTGSTANGNCYLGTATGAVDAWKTQSPDLDTDNGASTTNGEIGSIVYDAVPALHARANGDVRAPLTIAANTGVANAKIWNLYMKIFGGAPGTLSLTGWVVSTAKLDVQSATNQAVTVQLWNAADWVNGTGAVAGRSAIWEVPLGVSGTVTSPNLTAKTFNYDGTDINLKLVAFVPGGEVPEPGSLVAMFSGLVGLVGFSARRRK